MFVKGLSGNPGGRPRGIAAKAREHTDSALNVLVEGLGSEDDRVRITAAKELLDRGWGKAVAMTADVSPKNLDAIDDEQLDAAISVLESILGPSGAQGVDDDADHPGGPSQLN